MGRGITVSLFLVDGEPSGIVCAYLSNWTGQCIKIPRNLLDKSEDRPEVNGMGVYFLFGYSDDNPDDRIVYVGEADNVYRRLVQHIKDDGKSFWNEAVVFTSKDDFLTKGHVKYLEHELIKIAKENADYTVHNKNNATKSTLPEMSISDMETYLDNVKIIMPALGYYLFRPETNGTEESQVIYYLEQSGLKAKGISTNAGFTVLNGSEISIEIKDSLSIGYKNKREGLISKGIIEKIDGKYVFTKDLSLIHI
jgi:predicted GIY-YIG superfamily endonuclease